MPNPENAEGPLFKPQGPICPLAAPWCCNTAEALCEPLLRSAPGLPLDPMACP